jgi:hypothetical protein
MVCLKYSVIGIWYHLRYVFSRVVRGLNVYKIFILKRLQ